MEEAILKRLYAIRFQLYDTLGKENYGDSKKAMVTRGWREEITNRQSTRGFLGQGDYYSV